MPYVYKSWLEAPRWAGAPAFLRQLADQCGVDYTERYRETGLLHVTVGYKVEGHLDDCERFQRAILESVRQYNH